VNEICSSLNDVLPAWTSITGLTGGHVPHFLKKKFLHDFAVDTGLYMCELLVWLRVMFQSVFEVKVLYVNTDWPWYLLDAP